MGIAKLLDIYSGKKVLVTGHTGFKGSWLSIWLNMLGAKVIGYALDPENENGNYVLSNISNKITDCRADIRDKDKLNSIFNNEKPEIVFHLAAQPIVLDSYNSPVYTFETNVMGTVNVLEAARNTPSVSTVIIVTSDKCYENKEWIFGYREIDPMGGHDPYSASKGAAEIVTTSYRRSFFNPENYRDHKKALSSARAGNVIGGGDWAENRIIPDCIKALEAGLEIEVRSPEAIRPWQHVLEPLGGYLLLGANMILHPDKYTEAWNFGPEPDNIVNVEKLVEKIIQYYGKGAWIDISNQKSNHEAKLLSLDISKARTRLGWNPVLSFDETIEYTIEWYKNYKNQEVEQMCKNQINSYIQKWISRRGK